MPAILLAKTMELPPMSQLPRTSDDVARDTEVVSLGAIGVPKTCSTSTEGCRSAHSPIRATVPSSAPQLSSDCTSTIRSEELASSVRKHYATMINGDCPDNITHVLQQILGQRTLDMQNCSLPSVGSVLHDEGICKPCVFANKNNKNCRNGEACLFCHYDHKEKRRRSKRSKTLPICSGPGTDGATAQPIQLPLLPQPPPKCGTQPINSWRPSHQGSHITGGPNVSFGGVQESNATPVQQPKELQRLEDRLPRSCPNTLATLGSNNGGRTSPVEDYFDIEKWGNYMVKSCCESSDWHTQWPRQINQISTNVGSICFQSNDWLETGQENRYRLPANPQDRIDNHQWSQGQELNAGEFFHSKPVMEKPCNVLLPFAPNYPDGTGFGQPDSAYGNLATILNGNPPTNQAPSPAEERFSPLLDSVQLAAAKSNLAMPLFAEEDFTGVEAPLCYPGQQLPHLVCESLEGLKRVDSLETQHEELGILKSDAPLSSSQHFYSSSDIKDHSMRSSFQPDTAGANLFELPVNLQTCLTGSNPAIFGEPCNDPTVAESLPLSSDTFFSDQSSRFRAYISLEH